MRKRTLAVLAASTATLGVAGFAFADSHHEGGRKGIMIEKLDANGDGQITKEEINTAKAARFAEADANGDGGLTMAELDAFREAERARRMEMRKQRMFERADANGDGVISVDEFESRDRMFARVDTDGDGVLSAEELENMKSHHGKRGGPHRRGGPEN